MNRVLVLTDSRYLGQLMPRALVDALRGRGVPVSAAPVDRLVTEVRTDGGTVQAGSGAVQAGGGAVQARSGAPPDGRRDPPAPRPGDLVVPRTRDPFALSLLCRAQLDGASTVNRWEAIQAVRDKPHAVLLLARAGVPTPRTFLTDRPASLAGLPAAAWPLLLKPPYGDNGDGIVRVDSPRDLERLPWPDGMVLAQHYVDVAGVDVKL